MLKIWIAFQNTRKELVKQWVQDNMTDSLLKGYLGVIDKKAYTPILAYSDFYNFYSSKHFFPINKDSFIKLCEEMELQQSINLAYWYEIKRIMDCTIDNMRLLKPIYLINKANWKNTLKDFYINKLKTSWLVECLDNGKINTHQQLANYNHICEYIEMLVEMAIDEDKNKEEKI